MHKSFNNTIFIGKQVVYLSTCHSTNDVALKMASRGLVYDGALIITDNQTSGKGQRGNTWEAEASKNLTFSIVLKPSFLHITDQFYLNIVISLAITDYLSQIMDQSVKIKWPNDIYCNTNKLGGILIENSIKNNRIADSIVGIGLNVNQTNFNVPTATSISLICNQNFDTRIVLSKLLPNIENRYFQLRNMQYDKLKKDYYQKMYKFNEWSSFFDKEEFEGKIIGIDEIGRLLIDRKNGLKAFDIKEVRFLEK